MAARWIFDVGFATLKEAKTDSFGVQGDGKDSLAMKHICRTGLFERHLEDMEPAVQRLVWRHVARRPANAPRT